MPRCQLALTLLLAEAAGSRLATPPQLFDPAFTEVGRSSRLCHCIPCWVDGVLGARIAMSCSRRGGSANRLELRQLPLLMCPMPNALGVQVDKVLLREMGCALIPRNEHGRRVFGGSLTGSGASAGAAAAGLGAADRHVDHGITANGAAAANGNGGGSGQPQSQGSALVYLAHCKPELCNALLDANWSPGQLAAFAVIGELFQQ